MAKVLSIKKKKGKKDVVKANKGSCDGSPLAYFTLAQAFFQISIVTLIIRLDNIIFSHENLSIKLNNKTSAVPSSTEKRCST